MKQKLQALHRISLRAMVRNSVAVGIAVVAGAAHATAPDYTALTGAVDFTSTTTAILAIAALLAVVYMSMIGARLILGMIKGGR